MADLLFASEHPVGVCSMCRRYYPPSLLKAFDDPFDYALRLRTGEVIRFVCCDIRGDYVRVFGGDLPVNETPISGMMFPFPRGLDIRIDQIVWCADAPEGS